MLIHQKFMEDTLGKLSVADVTELDRILVSWRDVFRAMLEARN